MLGGGNSDTVHPFISLFSDSYYENKGLDMPQPQYRVAALYKAAFIPLAAFPLSQLALHIFPSHFLKKLVAVIEVPSGLFAIFFLPGIFLVPWFIKKRNIPLTDFFSYAFGFNIILLFLGTSALKVAGFSIGKWNLFLLIAVTSLGAAIVKARDVKSRYFIHDLDGFEPIYLFLIGGLIFLRLFFAHYFSAPLDHYWIVKGNPINPIETGKIADWDFQVIDFDEQNISKEMEGDMIALDDEQFLLAGDHPSIVYTTSYSQPIPLSLKFFVRSNYPGTLNLSRNKMPLARYTLPPLININLQDLFKEPYRRVFSRKVLLEPGRNEFQFSFSPEEKGRGNDVRVVLHDFSNMTRDDFLRSAKKTYILTQVGPMFDILEALDIGDHYRDKLFSYTYDLTPKKSPGYFVANQPFSFYMRMLALALFGKNYHSLQYVYWAATVLVLSVLLMLYKFENPRSYPLFTCLLVLAILMQSVNLINYRFLRGDAYFFSLVFFLALHFLLSRQPGWFTLFAFLSILTRNYGFILVFGSLVVFWCLYPSYRKKVLTLGGRLVLLMTVYLTLLFAIGVITGDLAYWTREFFNENIYDKFLLSGEGTSLGKGFFIFNVWVFFTAGFSIPLLFLKKDRTAWFILLVSLVFYILVCTIRFKKIYYLFLTVYPFVLIGIRNLSQMEKRYLNLRLWGVGTLIRVPIPALLFSLFLTLAAASFFYILAHPLVDSDEVSSMPDRIRPGTPLRSLKLY